VLEEHPEVARVGADVPAQPHADALVRRADARAVLDVREVAAAGEEAEDDYGDEDTGDDI